MPHIDITMIPGRDDTVKKELAVKVQQFFSKELNINKKFVSVSIEDVAKEEWTAHMERLKDKKMFVEPSV
ncbi:4-oxalocrotonate tautomerase family protein [[Clostridium] innocuum]|nr:4-oxalocrotonate tautomerase family protein [[Clostridium] innocuum]